MSFAPLNLNPGNNIVDAYLRGKQLAQQANQFSQEQQTKKEQREQEKDLAEKQLKQQHELESRHMDILQAANEIQQLHEKTALGQIYSETGTKPPDSTITQSNQPQTPVNQTPTTSTGAAPVVPQNMPISQQLSGEESIPEGFVKLSHPLLGTQIVPTPETLTKIQASRAGAVSEAQESAKEKLTKATQQAEFERQLPLELYKLNFAAQKDATDRASAEKIGQGHDAARIEAARSRINSDRTLRLVDTLSKQYDNSPVIKRYQVLQEAKQVADSIPEDSKDPTQHTQLLHAYAKALDPDQVVSQGAIQFTPSTVESLMSNLELKVDRLTSATGALTPDAIKKVKSTIANRLKIENVIYNNSRNQSINQIKATAPSEDPNVWIKDYSQNNYGPIEQKTLKNGTNVIVHKNLKTGQYETLD